MVPPIASIVRRPWWGSCLKQEQIIYEEQPFYLLERVPKPRENRFGTRYLVKLAVAGTVYSVFWDSLFTLCCIGSHEYFVLGHPRAYMRSATALSGDKCLFVRLDESPHISQEDCFSAPSLVLHVDLYWSVHVSSADPVQTGSGQTKILCINFLLYNACMHTYIHTYTLTWTVNWAGQYVTS